MTCTAEEEKGNFFAFSVAPAGLNKPSLWLVYSMLSAYLPDYTKSDTGRL
jgi:hypothetical protein